MKWQAISEAFLCADPEQKCELVRALSVPDESPASDWIAPNVNKAGRPLKPELVPARQVARRGLGNQKGRAAFLHAIAHIEFNAINLALDAALRFTEMPLDFVKDWLSVAQDEARHFQMLVSRMATLGASYGDYSAHDGLWQSAIDTADDVLARMAVVPRVLEARGLDVTPGMIQRLRSAGDAESAEVLAIILAEEVRHVRLGSEWFAYEAHRLGLKPDAAFSDCLDQYLPGRSFHALNHEARLAAGFSEAELSSLAARCNQ